MKLDYKKYMENNEENMHVDNEAFSLWKALTIHFDQKIINAWQKPSKSKNNNI